MPASAIVVPSPSSQSAAPTAPTGQSPARRPTFWYALPPPGRIGTRISLSSSPGATTVSYGPVWKSRAGTVRLPSGCRITIVALSAANAADRSSDGSAWHSEPPTVPQFRTIGSAMTRSASCRMAKCWPAAGSASRSACRASAPIRSSLLTRGDDPPEPPDRRSAPRPASRPERPH